MCMRKRITFRTIKFTVLNSHQRGNNKVTFYEEISYPMSIKHTMGCNKGKKSREVGKVRMKNNWKFNEKNYILIISICREKLS